MRRLFIVLLAALFLSFAPVNVCEEYKATIISVYDGDTVTADIEVGFGIHMIEKIRVYGINAPEVRGEEKKDGIVSRDSLRELIDGKEVKIISHGRGKYGRIVAEIIYKDINISDWLVAYGLAVYKQY
jgi:micrococcal nuclease